MFGLEGKMINRALWIIVLSDFFKHQCPLENFQADPQIFTISPLLLGQWNFNRILFLDFFLFTMPELFRLSLLDLFSHRLFKH